jgi:hypothetical protein
VDILASPIDFNGLPAVVQEFLTAAFSGTGTLVTPSHIVTAHLHVIPAKLA